MLDIKSTTHTARVPVIVVHISGNIDSSNFQSFQAYVDDLVAKGARYMLLELKGVERISSAGLRVIHNLFNKLRELHKDVNDDELRRRMSAGAYKSPYLKVAGLSTGAGETFRLGGFDIYIEVFEDEAGAIASFG